MKPSATDQYYQLGLTEALGDDSLGPREPLTDLLRAIGANKLAAAYVEGWAAGKTLLQERAAAA